MFSTNYDGGKFQMTNYKPQGDWIFLEKMDYQKEQTTDAGVIFTAAAVLDTVYIEARILEMGPGLPLPTGDVPEVDYKVGDKILYDARSRKDIYKEYDMIHRSDIIAIVEGED